MYHPVFCITYHPCYTRRKEYMDPLVCASVDGRNRKSNRYRRWLTVLVMDESEFGCMRL
jgi:hypothetical protein